MSVLSLASRIGISVEEGPSIPSSTSLALGDHTMSDYPTATIFNLTGEGVLLSTPNDIMIETQGHPRGLFRW